MSKTPKDRMKCRPSAGVFAVSLFVVLMVFQATKFPVVLAKQSGAIPAAQELPAGEGMQVPAVTPKPVKFATAVPYNSGGYYASSIAIADLIGDGKLDLVVANACESDAAGKNCDSGALSVLLGNGDGTFQVAVSYASGGVAGASVAIADVNGDGFPDIVMASQCDSSSDCDEGVVGVLLGNGDGTFQPAVTYDAGYVPDWIAIGDLNGDGFPDLAVANNSQCNGCTYGGVSVLLGNGDGTFQPPVTYSSGGIDATSVSLGDVNGDGHLDLVITNEFKCASCDDGGVSVLLGNGDGTFQPPTSYASGGYAALSVAVADVNGDGNADIIVTNLCEHSYNCADGIVGVMLGNGDGTFQPLVTYSSGGYGASSVAIQDVNGDGKPDLVVSNVCPTSTACNNGAVAVLLGNGDGSFQLPISFKSGGTDAASVAVGDLNSNGKPDLVAANSCSSKNDCNGAAGVLLNTSSAKTTVQVSSSQNPSMVDQPVTFVATVSSSSPIPDGEVITFYAGAAKLGTGTTINGAASLTTSFSTANSYLIKAKYPGDPFHKASSGTVHQVVIQ